MNKGAADCPAAGGHARWALELTPQANRQGLWNAKVSTFSLPAPNSAPRSPCAWVPGTGWALCPGAEVRGHSLGQAIPEGVRLAGVGENQEPLTFRPPWPCPGQ